MLSPRLREMRRQVRDHEHAKYRQASSPDLLAECEAAKLSWMQRAARLSRRMCDAEKVVIEPDERIVFTRTVASVPPVYHPEEWAAFFHGRTMHELGPISNICANWEMVLSRGLLKRREIALATRDRFGGDAEAIEFLDAAVETIDGVLDLAARYARVARERGRGDVAEVLDRVPALPPRTFHEALQSLRLCHAAVWMCGHYHVGLGRFDQYMWPYLQADFEAGRLDAAAAEELLAEFFIALNKDSDLYPGVQQGDNGQSLMLGGVRRDGSDGVNELTRMVLRVGHDVAMIDPKLNLRISGKTDLELLSLASELTRLGLGFPQYSNDEVVIPALTAHGYDLEDARDYTVAACWEFIIPGKGMEVVNIGAVSMPAAVDRALRAGLAAGDSLDGVLGRTADEMHRQAAALVDGYRRLLLPPAPWYSVLMDGCLENGRDLSQGLKYNNFGIHGACSASAADALAAADKFVFREGVISRSTLLGGLVTDFQNDEQLRCKLAEKGPKVGNDDPDADRILTALFNAFADTCDAISDNGRGGRVRPGSGSAMYYVWLAEGHDGMREPHVGATADGRAKGTHFSANLAPSPGVAVRGPISVLQTFAKIDYRRICNGGPITLELSDSVFRGKDSIRKVAMLVRTFAQLGCQQLQLNTVNVETLREAKRHPERHKNLIVRVWGWSGYFCELDEPYQDHIIGRHAFGEAAAC
jgi:pyruvate-formate lyase